MVAPPQLLIELTSSLMVIVWSIWFATTQGREMTPSLRLGLRRIEAMGALLSLVVGGMQLWLSGAEVSTLVLHSSSWVLAVPLLMLLAVFGTAAVLHAVRLDQQSWLILCVVFLVLALVGLGLIVAAAAEGLPSLGGVLYAPVMLGLIAFLAASRLERTRGLA